jgi:hypothetical protein
VNGKGLTFSAAAATLASVPAAVMLLGLPTAAAAHASTAPAVTTSAVTTHAVKAACDWASAYGAAGNGRVTYSSKVSYAGTVTFAGGVASAGSTSSFGVSVSARGSWHQVSAAGLPDPSTLAHAAGSPCDLKPAYHVGSGHSVTALSSTGRGKVTYAAWAGDSHSRSFAYGIATNYGGRWHQVRTVGLPKQYITGITVDSFEPSHAYAVFNEYSSRLIHGTSRCGCRTGHVFETWNAGRTWTNISGDLPGVVAGSLVVLENGRLVLATDAGIYTALGLSGEHTRWVHLGSGLPRVAVEDLTVGANNYIYAATHSCGTWRFKL